MASQVFPHKQHKGLVCRKEIIGSNYILTKCGWSGVVDDYVSHIRKQHPQSFFKMPDRTTFRWKIPYVGNQTDKSILCCKSRCFMYRINYCSTTNTIRHRFLPIENNVKEYCTVLVHDKATNSVYQCETDVNDYDEVEIKYVLNSDRTIEWAVQIVPELLE